MKSGFSAVIPNSALWSSTSAILPSLLPRELECFTGLLLTSTMRNAPLARLRLNFSSKSALTGDCPRNCSGEVYFDMVFLFFLNPIKTLAQNNLFVNSMY